MLIKNKGTNATEKKMSYQKEGSQDKRERERQDKREQQSISRQILEVQELTRETDVGGKTEKAAQQEVKKTFEEERGERRAEEMSGSC